MGKVVDVDEAMDEVLGKYIDDPLELETVKEKIIDIIADGLHQRLFPKSKNSKKRQV